MSILKVTNLVKRFGPPSGGFVAVDNISFSLEEGEILGILGPNGAGKTTVIQMLLGVLTPTSGQILYFGKNLIDNREEILEKINFSSTYTNLPWDLTVKENLTFISYLYKVKDRQKRINRIVEIFRLEDILNQEMKNLSSGQITRVNLAKSFINMPKVLLLDEPTASLDPEVAAFVRDLLLKERKEFKVSIIITSHDMSEVEEICDRIIFINKGRIIADNTPYNLAKTIKNTHVNLMVRDGLVKLKEFMAANRISYRIEGNYLIIDINEKDISQFLRTITAIGVIYEEISIEKPTLKDYFLEVARL